MANEYLVPASTIRYEEIIKKSRFIATVGRAETIKAAKSFIETIKKEFPNANHNCYAYQADIPKSTAAVGLSDDGEPHSTAGKPMLNILVKSEIGEIAAVVTRYFGGIKLGTGGLIRAYTGVLQKALEILPLQKKIITTSLTFTIKYNNVSAIKRIIALFQATIEKEDYKEEITYTVTVRKEKESEFIAALTQGTHKVNFKTQQL